VGLDSKGITEKQFGQSTERFFLILKTQLLYAGREKADFMNVVPDLLDFAVTEFERRSILD
jgi:hypothetical protein